MSFFSRRRKLLLGVVAGAAGAAAAYYWWNSYSSSKQEEKDARKQSINIQLSEIISETASAPGLDPGPEGETAAADGDSEATLDEALDSHLKYIQDVSTPQELDQLLPRIQTVLFEETDVAQLKAATGPDGQPLTAAAKLRLLAQLCFARTTAACFLIPLMDLYVRTKLNIIGRHLFLQEKLSKLQQPAAAARKATLPSRLTGTAVEAFLRCDHFADSGCRWLTQKAMAAADEVLMHQSLEAFVGPGDVVVLLRDMLAGLEGLVGHVGGWLDVLVVPPLQQEPLGAVAPRDMAQAMTGSAEAYRKARASAAMVDELQGELRQVLCSFRFEEALKQAVNLCFGIIVGKLHGSFLITQPPVSAGVQPAASPSKRAFPSPPATQPPGVPATANGSSSLADLRDAHAQPPQSPSTSTTPDHAAPASKAEGAGSPLRSSPAANGFATGMERAASMPASALHQQHSRRAHSPDSMSGGGTAAAAAAGGGGPAPASLPMRSSMPGGGSGSGLGAATDRALARPLARTLKLVQGACEPLFSNTRDVTQGIAGLQRVMTLCACAFASPPVQL